jgi:hypothetical protein
MTVSFAIRLNVINSARPWNVALISALQTGGAISVFEGICNAISSVTTAEDEVVLVAMPPEANEAA